MLTGGALISADKSSCITENVVGGAGDAGGEGAGEFGGDGVYFGTGLRHPIRWGGRVFLVVA